jgi:hypothetical protein
MTDWAAYFKSMKNKDRNDKAEIVINLRPHEVTVQGHEIPISTLSKQSTVGKLAHLAVANGWETYCGVSEYFSGDHLQANGKVKLGKIGKNIWFEAVKNNSKVIVGTEYASFQNAVMTPLEVRAIIEAGGQLDIPS